MITTPLGAEFLDVSALLVVETTQVSTQPTLVLTCMSSVATIESFWEVDEEDWLTFTSFPLVTLFCITRVGMTVKHY